MFHFKTEYRAIKIQGMTGFFIQEKKLFRKWKCIDQVKTMAEVNKYLTGSATC